MSLGMGFEVLIVHGRPRSLLAGQNVDLTHFSSTVPVYCHAPNHDDNRL